MNISDLDILPSVSDNTLFWVLLDNKERAIKWSDYQALIAEGYGSQFGTEFTTDQTFLPSVKSQVFITLDGATDTLTVPNDSDIPVGAVYTVLNSGASDLSVFAAAGLTCVGILDGTVITAGATATFTKIATTDWTCQGLSAP